MLRVCSDDNSTQIVAARAGHPEVSRLERARQPARRLEEAIAGTGMPPVGLVLGLCGLVAGALLWAAGLHSEAGPVAALGAGIGAGWGLTWRASLRRVSRPLDQIADSIETLAARDVLALVDEFAHLAQGEHARRLEVHATPVALPSDRSVRRVAEALNSTIGRLQAGAYQFSAASEEPCRRLFYVGADDYLLGCTCAEAMGPLLPPGGQVLLLMPRFPHAGVELRRRGFESMLRERFPTAEVVGTIESSYHEMRTGAAIRSFMRTHPRLAGVYCTEAMGALGVVNALASGGYETRPVVVCHDLVDGTIAGLESGAIAATVTQDPFGQGYDTPIHLFNALAHGWRPQEPRLITASELVTKENYRQFWRPYEGTIETRAMAERRPRPLGPSTRPLRIAVLGLEDVDFWTPVRNGVLAAAEKLAGYNATLEWIVPEGNRGFVDLSLRGPVVDRLVREGYDGIATAIYGLDLIPCLNRAVEAGVIVATFNSEASSLQGLVATLSKERKRLEMEATGLEVAAHHDALTGAYNRLPMNDDLVEVRDTVVATGQPATVIMIDIDHFKSYNDNYGHTAGDEVLRLVAHRIVQEIRPKDRLYRYGGEEFLVLLRDTLLEQGEAVASRIACGIATLGLTHEGNMPWGVVTVSAGVARVDPASAAAADCVTNADAALYRSKRSGRNTVATYQAELDPGASSGGVGAGDPSTVRGWSR
jgi:diguanylate cyclase (GGDEF)-like protein